MALGHNLTLDLFPPGGKLGRNALRETLNPKPPNSFLIDSLACLWHTQLGFVYLINLEGQLAN